ncbi:MAG: GWxTD domain-containing protein [Acidobacteriota bacterium]
MIKRSLPVLVGLLFVATLSMGLSAPQGKKKQKQQKREATTNYYRRWLDQDVGYIISKQEREVFKKLATSQEKDRFIEEFWYRRDPDLKTRRNEFKEEHYRRIQYANDHFNAGIPGWKTDRGRIYIMFGPPDRKESHPNGGWYQRKAYEGGGETSVFPFEVWEYRYIDGVGTEVELEFVDLSGANLYRLTMDPQEKDAFLTVPGMGLTFNELYNPAFNQRKSVDRVLGRREGGLLEHAGVFERAKDHPFQKSELMLKIAKAPAIRYTDLRDIVTTSVYYDQLPFHVETDRLQITENSYLVPVTIFFNNSDISFARATSGWSGRLQVYGVVTTLSKRLEFEFDDDIMATYTDGEVESAQKSSGAYQRKLALSPGRYKLDLILRDSVSGKMGTQSVGINVPAASAGELTTSSIVLTRKIEASTLDMSQNFVLGPFKIKPQVDGKFPRGEFLGFYMEIYNFKLDQATQKPKLEVGYAITHRGEDPASFKVVRQNLGLTSDRVYLARMVQLLKQEPGGYDLVCRITDRVGEQSITTRAPFTITAAPTKGP